MPCRGEGKGALRHGEHALASRHARSVYRSRPERACGPVRFSVQAASPLQRHPVQDWPATLTTRVSCGRRPSVT